MRGLDGLGTRAGEFEGLPLSCYVIVRNGRGGVAIKEARKEWDLPKEVFEGKLKRTKCCPQKPVTTDKQK
jgi:hypothetical protein